MDEEGPQRLRHLHRHKAQDREHGEKQEKAGPQTVKTDPLISRFCRHTDRTEKYSFGMHAEIVWTDTLTSRRRLRGRDSQRGWWGAVWLVCIQCRTVCAKADTVVSRSLFLNVELLSKFALKHWLLCFSWGSVWERNDSSASRLKTPARHREPLQLIDSP